jgi:hypothetical protein
LEARIHGIQEARAALGITPGETLLANGKPRSSDRPYRKTSAYWSQKEAKAGNTSEPPE